MTKIVVENLQVQVLLSLRRKHEINWLICQEWMGSITSLHGQDQYSFSDNQFALGAQLDCKITVREFVPKLGAGIVYLNWRRQRPYQTQPAPAPHLIWM